MKVLLSTLNGMRTLPRMFRGLSRLKPPKGGYELHVADNGSSDETAAFLARWKSRLPLRIHDAPAGGKNAALNQVLDQIVDDVGAHELVVLTDDDVLPAPDWLAALEHAASANAQTVFTGPITPIWPGPAPDWMTGLTRYYGSLFTVTAREAGPCACIEAWGPNMAVRGSVFRSGIRFNSGFGPDGTQSFPMGSETELMRRLDQLGHEALFVAGAKVGHMLRDEVLTREFIRARAFRHGLGCGLMGRNESLYDDAALVALGLRNMAGAVIRWPIAGQPEKARREYQWKWGSGVLVAMIRPAADHRSSTLRDVESVPEQAIAD